MLAVWVGLQTLNWSIESQAMLNGLVHRSDAEMHPGISCTAGTHTYTCVHTHRLTHRHTNIHVRGHACMLAHTQTDKQTTSKPSGIAKGHVPPQ